MGDRELTNWVNDQLYALLGYAEGSIAAYIVALGKKTASAEALTAQLVEQGLPSSGATRQFAAELISRVPRSAGGASAHRKQERAKVAYLRKNEQYALLSEDEEEEAAHAEAKVKVAAKEDKKRKKQLRKQKAAESSDEDEEALQARKKMRARQERGGRWQEDEEQDMEKAAERLKEEQRDADQLEKEEFEERLRKKDESATKKTGEPGMSKSQKEEAAKRRYETEEERAALMPALREVSRQEYLKKREKQKLDELRDAIRDEEYLFEDVELTEKEKEDMKYKKQVYDLAMQKTQEVDDVVEYRLPEAYDEVGDASAQERRFAVARERYKEVDDKADRNPFRDQETWEAEKIGAATLKYGSREGRTEKAGEKEYDYVFEDQIDFIKTEALAGTLSDEESEDEAEVAAKEKMTKRETMQACRDSLPIYPYRDSLLAAVDEHQVVVIVGETGSGKTTQIPQYLHEHGYTKRGMIGCTQPRRVAAMSVAARVADEMDVKLGAEVGFSIRFEDCTSDKTQLKYMTDGMLLREFLGEPDLASYSCMMVDEAHERTLHTDVLFGLVKDICRFRPDIKLLISSATLDAEKFSEYFDYAPIFRIPGRRFPVDIFYTKAPEADYLDAAIVTVLQVHVSQPPGDILVFFTGQEEIETAEEILKQRMRGKGSKLGEMIVAPIYAALPSDLQAKIFEPTPPGARKVVLATNIAETSLTIDGIKYVIDPGFCKQNSYNPRSGMESLIVTPVSKASALQRSGRAGRTSAGKCFRMFTAWSYQHELDDNTVPEIQRTNLGNVVLMLKSLGINDLIGFDFMDPPPAETLLRALEQLYALGALNDRGELTKLGRRMAEFPLDPMLSKMMVTSEKYGCSEEAVSICCMMSVGNTVFYRPKDKAVHADNAHKNFHRGGHGDHIAMLGVFQTWADTNFSTQWCYENFVQVRSMKRARDVRDQLVGLLERVEIELVSDAQNTEIIKKTLTAGFFYHTAKLQKNGSYKTVKNPQTVHIHPSSGLAEELPKWLIYHELVYTSKEYMRQVTEIKPEWLVEIAPHYYKKKDIEAGGTMKMPKAIGKVKD